MSDRPAPKVFMRRNPWGQSLDDGVVLGFLSTGANVAEEKIQGWISAGQRNPDGPKDDIAPQDAAFAQVILDPTRPRWQTTLQDRIMAVILYGDPDVALTRLPNGGAKADAHDRHGRPNLGAVTGANFLLGDGDFAWGGSVEYKGAISGGSGLTVMQDMETAFECLRSFMDLVHTERDRWVEERRRAGKQSWYNRDNVPGQEYQDLLDLDAAHWFTPSFA